RRRRRERAPPRRGRDRGAAGRPARAPDDDSGLRPSSAPRAPRAAGARADRVPRRRARATGSHRALIRDSRRRRDVDVDRTAAPHRPLTARGAHATRATMPALVESIRPDRTWLGAPAGTIANPPGWLLPPAHPPL